MKLRLAYLTLALMLAVVGCKKEPTGTTTPLHRTASRGDIEQVRKLIARRANVNAKDGSDETPLHEAAIRGHKDVVELLIAHGAYVDAKNWNDDTPLHDAAFLVARKRRIC